MKIKVLALVSGGLDSLLAAKFIKDQGLEVIGLHFKIPSCKLDVRSQVHYYRRGPRPAADVSE